jgi:hypothetical protein
MQIFIAMKRYRTVVASGAGKRAGSASIAIRSTRNTPEEVA